LEEVFATRILTEFDPLPFTSTTPASEDGGFEPTDVTVNPEAESQASNLDAGWCEWRFEDDDDDGGMLSRQLISVPTNDRVFDWISLISASRFLSASSSERFD
jgi:hypothetical protein